MTYRNILVHVDSCASSHFRLKAAGGLASRLGCSLTGAFLAETRMPNYIVSDALTGIPPDVMDGFLKERFDRLEQIRAAAKDAFLAAAGSRATTRWLDLNGDTEDELVKTARRFDLTVLPPQIAPAFDSWKITAADVGMASGGPILLLKSGGYPASFGQKVLIAWKETREAARALRDAWPFLETAKEIHFLRVGRGAPKEDVLIQQYLADHGCPRVVFHVDEEDDAPVEDRIRIQVGVTGADLLVLGLYGHSRLRESVFGGVSRNLLTDPPMPLLVSH